MKKQMLAWLACFGFMMGICGSVEANLITNGSFEDGNYTGGSFVTLSESSVIPGWKVAAGSIDWIGDYWKASDGTKSIDLAGFFQQGLIMGTSFATEIGKTYRVQFDMAGNPDKRYDKTLVTVSTADESGPHSFTFDQANNTRAEMGWETKYFDFVASDTISNLFFGDDTGNADQAWGAALDNVRVDIVPEPSTLLLLVVGLAGFGIFGRRFRRTR